jgi:hypothetical protein
MSVFWAVAPCSLINFSDVSEVLAVYIIRAVSTILAPFNRQHATVQAVHTEMT